MPGSERPVASYAPSLRSIKVYPSGRIKYQGKSGSVIGATASVEAYGSKEGRRRDKRQVVLRIEGPEVSIVAPLPINGVQPQKHARHFAAIVNDLATELAGQPGSPWPSSSWSGPAPLESEPAASGPSPPAQADILEQLERLGRLRDSGVLTEDEFKAQKAALLRGTPQP
jgi:Short C-terminal domain